MTEFLLKLGDTGQRVKDMQWLFSGHNRYGIQTYWGELDGDFGPATGKASKDMKWRIGYEEKNCVPTAGSLLRSYLIPLSSSQAQRRPLSYILRASTRRPKFGYPLSRRGALIGWPYQGTHTRGNWESDRACDIAVPVGTPVLACFPGVIGTQFGPLFTHSDPRLLGLRFHILGDADEAYYAHLSKFEAGMKPGVVVRTGDQIGESGSANGIAHLHFALKNGWPPSFLAAGQV